MTQIMQILDEYGIIYEASKRPAQHIVYYEGHLYLRGSSQTNRLTAAEAISYHRSRENNKGEQS